MTKVKRYRKLPAKALRTMRRASTIAITLTRPDGETTERLTFAHAKDADDMFALLFATLVDHRVRDVGHKTLRTLIEGR
jgi:hypothetical protein